MINEFDSGSRDSYMSRVATHNLKFLNDLTVDQFKELQQIARQTTNYDPYCRALLSIEASLMEANPLETLDELDSLAPTYQTLSLIHI